MADQLTGLSTLPPQNTDQAVALAEAYYGEGIKWLIRMYAANNTESRTRCATAAGAFFGAGQLALAITTARHPW